MIKRKNSLKTPAPHAQSGVFTLSALDLGAPAGAMLIAFAVFIAYLPCVTGEFVLDDNLFLTNNPIIVAPDGLLRFWCTAEAPEFYPASYTTNWIEWRLWGANPACYHITNLILHLSEALLIWIILRKLSIPGAFWAALIFALHPVNVESVAWIAQRRNMAAMLFFLLSILWYLKGIKLTADSGQGTVTQREPAGQWYWLSFSAFVLAMLGKGSTAVLPALVLGILLWLRPIDMRRHFLRLAPFFAIAVALTAVNVWFQTRGTEVVIRNAGFAERLAGGGAVVWFYLYKALLPLNLAFVYPQWHVDAGKFLSWLPLLAALALTAFLWLYRKTWTRPLLFAWGFFCVALVPVMGFVDVGFMQYSLVADHYQHIAIIGLIALAAAGLGTWQTQNQGPLRRPALAVALAAAAALVLLTWRQSGIYHDNLTLYQSTLALNPNCWMAHNNLGVNLARAGNLPEAIDHYNNALRLKENYPEARNNLGNALVRIGRPKEAIEQYQEALRLQPDYPEAHDNLLNALALTGRPEEAIEYYNKALRLDPRVPQTHYKLGNALACAGREAEAIEQFQQALALAPDYAQAHVNLGNALVRIGRIEEAIDHYRQALRIKPEDNAARVNLISAYARAGRSAEAVAAAEEALEIARNQGQTALAKQIEDWLNAYRAGLSVLPDAQPPSKSATPKP